MRVVRLLSPGLGLVVGACALPHRIAETPAIAPVAPSSPLVLALMRPVPAPSAPAFTAPRLPAVPAMGVAARRLDDMAPLTSLQVINPPSPQAMATLPKVRPQPRHTSNPVAATPAAEPITAGGAAGDTEEVAGMPLPKLPSLPAGGASAPASPASPASPMISTTTSADRAQVAVLIADIQRHSGLSAAQLARLQAARRALAAGEVHRARQLARRLREEVAHAYRPYVVRPGDNLWKIAARPEVYGNPYLWPLILRANPSLKNAQAVRPGMRLRIKRYPTADQIGAALAYAHAPEAWRPVALPQDQAARPPP